ncbi:hypothetical protein AO262_07560 [Pseudomonas fluorescens ABAC62]|nr:hypothetical protein AO262_07560 [Pseudomonas fluorescens ABAC62]
MKLVEGNVKSYDPNTCRLEVEVDRNGSRVVVMTKEPLSLMPDERIRFQMVEDRWGPCACNVEHLN